MRQGIMNLGPVRDGIWTMVGQTVNMTKMISLTGYASVVI